LTICSVIVAFGCWVSGMKCKNTNTYFSVFVWEVGAIPVDFPMEIAFPGTTSGENVLK